MFPSAKTSKLAQRSFGALRLTRSFLMLEDDYDVDWEVDEDELTQIHPHRMPLRESRRWRRSSTRRPGQIEPVKTLCLSPVKTVTRQAKRTSADRALAGAVRPKSHR